MTAARVSQAHTVFTLCTNCLKLWDCRFVHCLTARASWTDVTSSSLLALIFLLDLKLTGALVNGVIACPFFDMARRGPCVFLTVTPRSPQMHGICTKSRYKDAGVLGKPKTSGAPSAERYP